MYSNIKTYRLVIGNTWEYMGILGIHWEYIGIRGNTYTYTRIPRHLGIHGPFPYLFNTEYSSVFYNNKLYTWNKTNSFKKEFTKFHFSRMKTRQL
jgi:hypothetical protein